MRVVAEQAQHDKVGIQAIEAVAGVGVTESGRQAQVSDVSQQLVGGQHRTY